MVLLGVSFLLVSWVVGKLPKTVCKGWMEYATPALQVVIVPYQLGEHKRVRNRMNSSKVHGAVYWAIALASIVTLERCRRSCGGALSRNLHRGSINL